MNYTREPLIETVITSKEGSKLIVRNSKGVGEEYLVDAVEVVSFGNAIFYRSDERPRPFLLPVTDFEVVEQKEAKMVLKNVAMEKSIKIGGGKIDEPSKSKRKKQKNLKIPQQHIPPNDNFKASNIAQPSQHGVEETQVSPSILRKLFPPPPTLIKEKLSAYKKDEEKEIVEELVKRNEDLPIIEQIEKPLKENNFSEEKVEEKNQEIEVNPDEKQQSEE